MFNVIRSQTGIKELIYLFIKKDIILDAAITYFHPQFTFKPKKCEKHGGKKERLLDVNSFSFCCSVFALSTH